MTRLNSEINKALKSSPVTTRSATYNAVFQVGTREGFAAFIDREQALWRDVVSRAKIAI
jgi:hypothetical protein